MPHFIIDCSKNLLKSVEAEQILQTVYDSAGSTGLFSLEGSGGIKVRIRPYEHYLTVGAQDDLIHVFANIMEGRTTEQKADLSERIVAALVRLFPDVLIISINVREFEKEIYRNRGMLKGTVSQN